jgi:glycine/D-amino acid oxidase-like deaminating enzyme
MDGTDWTGEYRFSIWEQESFLRKADLLVLGSGIVGLSAAISLKEREPSLDILILDRGFLPSGASTRNAGFACFGSVSELWEDMQSMDSAAVEDTLCMRWQGLGLLRNRVGDSAIQYQAAGGVEVFQSEEDFRFYSGKIDGMNQWLEQVLGLKGVYRQEDDLCDRYGFHGFHGAILNQYEGVLHPGEMMARLIQIARDMGIRFLFGAEVDRFAEDSDGVRCYVKGGAILCRQLLIATNGFAAKWLPSLALKPARNLVLVTAPLEKALPGDAGFHMDKGYLYWRRLGDRLLLGGGRNLDPEGETTEAFGHPASIREYLCQIMETHILPGTKTAFDYVWSGIMGIGAEKKPIITWHSERIAVAVRMGGMGVAIGSVVGQKASELILNKSL